MSFQNCEKLCANQKLRLLLGGSKHCSWCTLSDPVTFLSNFFNQFLQNWICDRNPISITNRLSLPQPLPAFCTQHKAACTSAKGETEVAVTFSPDAASPGFAHIKDANLARGSRRRHVPAAGYVPLAHSNLLAYPWKASPRPSLRQDLNTRTMMQCCPHHIASQGSASSRLSHMIFSLSAVTLTDISCKKLLSSATIRWLIHKSFLLSRIMLPTFFELPYWDTYQWKIKGVFQRKRFTKFSQSIRFS